MMRVKGRPHSTVKVPENIPQWKSTLYRKIWRAAFLVLGDETLARRIAIAVCAPPATKPSPGILAAVPGDVPVPYKMQWAKIAQKVKLLTDNESAARQIAYAVAGKELTEVNGTKSATRAQSILHSGATGVLVHAPGLAVKAVELHDGAPSSDFEGWVEGYLVSWGNTQDTDLQGEFFSPRTQFCLDWFVERPVLYHHGMDGEAGLRKIGTFKTIKADDIGLWVQAQLDLRDRYARAVYDMVKAKQFGWSSGSVDHLVKIGENGEILIWPLIEGSITPTPAQPAKTAVRPIKATPVATVQAFKALLSNDDASSEYLRGLTAHLRPDDRVATTKNAQFDRNSFPVGVKTMGKYSDSSFYITSAVAKAFGLKDVSPEELKAVAEEVKDVVSDEVAAAAAEELETEAAMAALEDEMGVTAASYRNYRGRRGFSYRNDDELAMAADELMPPAAAAYGYRGFGYRNDDTIMGDDDVIAAASDQATEDAVVRAVRRRLLSKAARGIATDQPYLGTPASEDLRPLEAETAPKSLRRSRARRGYAYRQNTEEALAADEVVADVVAKAMRRGILAGYRSAFRQIETEQAISADDQFAVEAENGLLDAAMSDMEIAEAAQAYRSGYQRGASQAMRQLQDETVMADELMPPAAAAYGYRGYGYRNDDELAMAADELVPPAAAAYGYRGYGYRTNADGTVIQPPAAPTSYAPAPDGYEPVPGGPVDTNTKYYGRRGFSYRNDDELAMAVDELVPPAAAAYGYRGFGYRNDDELAMATDEAIMGGDDLAAMTEEPFVNKSYGRRGQPYRSSGAFGAQNEADYWRGRYNELATMEAPGQRNAFKSLRGVVDEADRPGAYKAVFDVYMRKGIDLMTESQKYILQGKGATRWQNATFAYDPATKSVKTYMSGSDASTGFLVPEDWVNELNANIMAQTVMAGDCRTRVTTSDRIVQPNLVTTDARRSGAAVVRWPGESPADTDSRTVEDQFSEITIPIHVMLMSLVATNSTLEDASFNLEEQINQDFSEAVAIAYDQLIWYGDGQGKLQGITVNQSVIGSPSLGIETVGGYVATGSPDGLVTADTIKKMYFHLPEGYRQRAKWYMNSNTGYELSTLKDGEGRYLIDDRDEGLKSVGRPDRLMGKPVVYNDWATNIAENAFPMLLADLNRAYVIGRRVEFSIRRFDDSTFAQQDQVLFLGRARLGGQVIQPAAIKVLKVAAA